MRISDATIRGRFGPLRRTGLLFNRRHRRGFRLFKSFPDFNYNTIVDIGAFNGEFTDLALATLKPRRVVLVEADPVSAAKLSRRYQKVPTCEIVHAAVSDKTHPLKLRINSSRDSSSILPICEVAEQTFALDMQEMESVEVPGITLDDLFESLQIGAVDLLKVDIQGAERMMIEGGKKALTAVRSLYIEVSFEEFYEGCALFGELDAMLKGCGFKLRSLLESRIGVDHCLAYANAHYLRV
jgi:FkbM family methyltransferase